jgi:hypothetical protein
MSASLKLRMLYALLKEKVLGFSASELYTVAGVLYVDISKEFLLPLMEESQDGLLF